MDFFKDEVSSSSDSNEENKREDDEPSDDDQANDALIPMKDPTELVFDRTMEKVNDFMLQVRSFESITGAAQNQDIWRI
jgi:hypothetical protein